MTSFETVRAAFKANVFYYDFRDRTVRWSGTDGHFFGPCNRVNAVESCAQFIEGQHRWREEILDIIRTVTLQTARPKRKYAR